MGAWSWGDATSRCCKQRCYLKQVAGVRSRPKDSSFTSGYVGAAPPTPAPAAKAYISAFSTMNGTDGDVASLRVFLGFWGNPDQENPPPQNRTVKVTVTHDAAKGPTTATMYII